MLTRLGTKFPKPPAIRCALHVLAFLCFPPRLTIDCLGAVVLLKPPHLEHRMGSSCLQLGPAVFRDARHLLCLTKPLDPAR